MKTTYLLPKRIIEQSENISNSAALFNEKVYEASLIENDVMTIKGKGTILLDFGEEIMGGARIVSGYFENTTHTPCKLRLRFGESASEASSDIFGDGGATNDHAIRDTEVLLPMLSDSSYCETGFRFLRIDVLEEGNYQFKSIVAFSKMHEYVPKKEYVFSDKLTNDIYLTAKRTLDLCVQNNLIWDGIKRDRLVWIGDMEPEVHALLHLYGFIPEIENSLAFSEATFKLPSWMNGIPLYSCWYLFIVSDVINMTDDISFLKRRKEYVDGVIKQFLQAVLENGDIDYMKVNGAPSSFYFVDWPSSELSEREKKDANINLLKITLSSLKKAYQKCQEDTKDIDTLLSRLSLFNTGDTNNISFLAFKYLANPKDDQTYQKLINHPEKGMSTFLSYYVLSAIADRDLPLAVETMKKYYGGMLSLGATSFWEDFDLAWANNGAKLDEWPITGKVDVHRKYGKYCYVGLRHSLCHGWSSGPISFLIEHIKDIGK